MKIRILTILFLVFISCQNVTEKETEQVQIVVDSTGLKIETVEKNPKNLKLTSFLENPIDLQEFKNIKKKAFTTGVTKGMTYHLHPQIKDSIFYQYNYLNQWRPRLTAEIVVFKNGENKHTYDDKTEILIELKVFGKDSDLGKANLIGLSKAELETEFGSDYLPFVNGIIYYNKNKVLIFELDNLEVKSYRYIKLNTESVDQDLIRQILE
jgi:hypothetical protein